MPDENPTTAALLKQYLADRDEACPGCDYNLRGLTGNTCPECGEALRLRVGLVYPKMKLMLAGLIGLAMGVGFNVLLLIFVAIQIFAGGLYPDWLQNVIVLTTALAIEGIALFLWLRFAMRIMRCNRSTGFWLVIGCWALTAINVLWFSMSIR